MCLTLQTMRIIWAQYFFKVFLFNPEISGIRCEAGKMDQNSGPAEGGRENFRVFFIRYWNSAPSAAEKIWIKNLEFATEGGEKNLDFF